MMPKEHATKKGQNWKRNTTHDERADEACKILKVWKGMTAPYMINMLQVKFGSFIQGPRQL